LVVGGGPAGLCAAITAASQGTKVTVIERDGHLGGQLVKQTHMFFGSQKQYASLRGIDICGILEDQLEEYKDLITVYKNSTAIGIYEDGVLTVEHEGKYLKIKPDAFIICTGASEKFLAFPNNDLPGIYGAGAVQTLMNLYGVKPGDNVVMVGCGNIGLIVSYQMLQAGVNVKAIVDAAPKIGGYLVHAAKVRRMGVPIMTSTTVKQAHGTEKLTGVTLINLDEKFNQIEGTEQDLDCDILCISVGLSPLTELLWQIGCEMSFIPQLGGHVAIRNDNLETTVKNVFIAGDIAGVEEASAAMVEGRIAGLCAANSLGHSKENFDELLSDYREQLNSLRDGPVGQRIKSGLALAVK
ncbi:MAG: NAD(P)/FAD-dependent oxidoreductase, partial [Oscillospiraceae bacterium]